MLKAYISGPLRASSIFETRQNVEQARTIAQLFWRLGFATFCPHLNTEGMIGMLEREDLFIAGDLEWLKHTNVLVLLSGWKSSEGAKEEAKFARACGILILEQEFSQFVETYSRRDGGAAEKYWSLDELRKVAELGSFAAFKAGDRA